jgi:hypothetical protein
MPLALRATSSSPPITNRETQRVGVAVVFLPRIRSEKRQRARIQATTGGSTENSVDHVINSSWTWRPYYLRHLGTEQGNSSCGAPDLQQTGRPSNGYMLNNELGSVRKWWWPNFPGGNENKHDKHQSGWTAYHPRFEPVTCRLHVIIVNSFSKASG